MSEGLVEKAALERERSSILAQKIGSTFAVNVPCKDLDQDDSLRNILANLCTRFERGAVPKELAGKLKKKEEKLKEVKLQYFEQILVYDAIHQILLDEECKDVTSFTPNSKLYEDLRTKLNCIETCNYSTLGRQDLPILNLDRDFIMKSSPEISRELLKREIIPKVEEVLTNMRQAIIEILHKEGSANDGTTLGGKIEELTHTLVEEKRKLFESKNNLNLAFQQCNEAFSATFDLMDSLLNKQRLHDETKCYQDQANYLQVKYQALQLKARMLGLQALLETYTDEEITKLRHLSSRLEADLKHTDQQLTSQLRKLHDYESVGSKFNKIVEEYGRLKDQLIESHRVLTICQETG